MTPTSHLGFIWEGHGLLLNDPFRVSFGGGEESFYLHHHCSFLSKDKPGSFHSKNCYSFFPGLGTSSAKLAI